MDDEDEFEPGVDGCHHGLGFDEDCEWCDHEIWAEGQEKARQARLKKQPDLFEPQQGQPSSRAFARL